MHKSLSLIMLPVEEGHQIRFVGTQLLHLLLKLLYVFGLLVYLGHVRPVDLLRHDLD